jgi:hypothetical protein
MHANTSPLQPSADGPDTTGPAAPAPALSPLGRSCASVLAATAIESGVDEHGIRRLFARCAETGFGLSADFEAGVLAEFAALRAS